MSARDDLADVLKQHRYDREKAVCTCSDFIQVGLRCDDQTHEQHIAEVILAAGWTPPTKTLGYLVVDRDGKLIGSQFTNLEAAQAFADEWTADCKTAGIDWDYRVVILDQP